MKKIKTCNAILMITGTSVGTGILGLPIVTSSAGLIPTFIAFIIAWIFMTLAALNILDVKMKVRGNSNLSSLIKQTLGRTGQYTSSIIILLLLYALLCTYMMAGSAWLHVMLSPVITSSLPLVTIVFTLFLALVILCGERFIYNINNVMAIGLILSFTLTVGMSLAPVHADFITHRQFLAILPSLPLLLTTFGFSIIVPSMTEYLEYDRKSSVIAIIVGGLVALLAYAVWEWVTLSHIPLEGTMSFHKLKQSGDNGTGVILALSASVDNNLVSIGGRIFAIFAAVTSFFGVSLALMHFLADGLKIKAIGKNRLVLLLITFIPPMIITTIVPRAFVQVLSFAGIFVAVLLGLFPVFMAYRTYKHKKTVIPLFTALFFIVVIMQEMVNLYYG